MNPVITQDQDLGTAFGEPKSAKESPIWIQ